MSSSKQRVEGLEKVLGMSGKSMEKSLARLATKCSFCGIHGSVICCGELSL